MFASHPKGELRRRGVAWKDWKERSRLLAGFTTLQGIVQFVSALSGLLLVRVLDKQEFAAYTIATSLQTILDVLTDAGIGSGTVMIGGRIWQSSEALSMLSASAFQLRKWLMVVAMPLGVVSAMCVLRQQEISWTYAVLLTATVVLALWGMFTSSLCAIVLRLHGRYIGVQKSELVAALARLALLGGFAVMYLNAVLAMLISAIGISLQAVLLRRKASAIITWNAPIDRLYRGELVAVVRKQFLWAYFFAFQGQITIWLISLFGTADRVAEVGALGRLAVVFVLFSSVLGGVVVPTFARCDSLGQLTRLFVMVLLGYAGVAGLLMFASLVFPSQILVILGAKYAELHNDVPWLVAGSVLGGLNGVLYALVSARGWIWHLWLVPPVTVALQVLLLRVLDVGSVRGVLVFGLISAVPVVVVMSYMTVRGLWKSWRAGTIAPRAQ